MHCWARYLFIIVVAVLGTGQMVTACGQKGDLYLPEREPGEQKPGSEARGKDVPEVQTGESLEVEEDVSAARAGGAASGK